MSTGGFPYRLKVIGKCGPDEMFLLRARIGTRKDKWMMDDDGSVDANAILYNLDDRAGQAAWDARITAGSKIAQIAFRAGPPPEEAEFSITKPLRGFQVETLLDEVEAKLGGQGAPARAAVSAPRAAAPKTANTKAAAPTPPPPPAKPAAASATGPTGATNLLQLLRNATDSEPMAISLSAAPALLVSPKVGMGYSVEWGDLTALAHAPTSEIRWETVSSADMERQARESGLRRRRMDELLWFAALEGSEGQPLDEMDMAKRMQLKALPDFGRLYHRPTHVRIGVMMKYHALLPEEVAQRARASLPDVIDFYNACICLDLLEESEEAKPRKSKQVSAERAGLFRRIMTRLTSQEAVG